MLGRELVELLQTGISCELLRSRFAHWEPKGMWAKSGEDIPVRLMALDLDELDITRADEVRRVIGEMRPTLVINAAAYTDVDGCETHEAQAMAVNADGPANLAEACRACDARLVHVSTDYVFDGKSAEPYAPDHPVAPQSAYGRTKAAGEEAIRSFPPEGYLIVRTSWLYGKHGKNFVKTILKLAAERPELQVVTDQVGRPTYAADLAAALLVAGLTGATGTHHFCNAGMCSWHQFAVEIAKQSGLTCRVLSQTTAELNRSAQRPAYSPLNTESFTLTTGVVPRLWQEALAECLVQLA